MSSQSAQSQASSTRDLKVAEPEPHHTQSVTSSPMATIAPAATVQSRRRPQTPLRIDTHDALEAPTTTIVVRTPTRIAHHSDSDGDGDNDDSKARPRELGNPLSDEESNPGSQSQGASNGRSTDSELIHLPRFSEQTVVFSVSPEASIKDGASGVASDAARQHNDETPLSVDRVEE